MQGSVSGDLQVDGWLWREIPHGFTRPETPPAEGYALRRARQVHGARILRDAEAPVSSGVLTDSTPEADGLVATQAGEAVAIATADCVPVLLTDTEGRRVAAIHAGWRGTLARITEAGVKALYAAGARPGSVEAAIGPCIGPCCFEVEADFRDRFAESLGEITAGAWQDGRPGHGSLDLRLLNRRQLELAGLAPEAIHDIGGCTFCGPGGFASYRRDGSRAGRQLSWIGVRP